MTIPDPAKMFCPTCQRGPLFSWERTPGGHCLACGDGPPQCDCGGVPHGRHCATALEPAPEPPGTTSEQAMQLPPGVYRVFWTEAAGGGMSVAAIGMMYSGKRWLAPANWTAKDERFPNVASSASWHDVERVERIVCDEPESP